MGTAARRASAWGAHDRQPHRRRRARAHRRAGHRAAGLGDVSPGRAPRLAGGARIRQHAHHNKKLTRTDTTFAIIFWMNLIQLPLALILSNPLFVTKLGLADVAAAITVGISGLASHYCLANAFRWGDASVVVPLDFLRIPLIAVVGWWLYGERLDGFVFAGAALIITGILWNLRSE